VISRKLTILVCVVCVAVVMMMAGGVQCVAQSPAEDSAQSDGFFASWQNRVSDTLAQQPAWPIPVITASSGLLQVARTDFVRQIAPAGTDTWNYGNTKGINLIPWYKVEFDVLLPPYIQHNSKAEDGFGDISLLLKYRLAAGNAEAGNYSISFSVAGTMPTGQYKNGSLGPTVSPTLCAGKGFGKVDVQSTLGAVLPADYTAKLGRVVVWNSVAQYHAGKLFWPEIESNTTFYHGGPNNGRAQNFITPGIMVSKFKLERNPRNRLALMFGGGMQIATTRFHTYNHGLVITTRMQF
jgi:outer membrane putative beta-barrel porin/alpha-amylase